MRRSLWPVPARVAISTCATALAIATVGLTGQASGTAGRVMAKEARKIYLVENAQLHLTKEGEATLIERGQTTGTFNAPVSSALTLSPGHVTAVFTIYPRGGGSISGKGQASYVVRGSIGYYGGSLEITRGTGAYRHASGKGVGISGTINHLNFNLSVKVHGWINL
jgi:hypothetical protein